MNSSQFMDKQIMDLSGSQNSNIFELLNPQEEQHNNGGGGANKELKEDILASYDFQPIRPLSSSSKSVNLDGSNLGGTRVWNSADSKTNTYIRIYGSVDANESTKVTHEKDHKSIDAMALSEIDRAVKKHADDLLHAIEGVSARLSQMESRTRNLESSVDELKASVESNHGSTEGKLRLLENVLREVQTGVQVLRDKQEIAEAHLQLAKLQASKGDQQPESQNSTTHSDSLPQPAFAPQQSHQPLLPPVAPPQPLQPLPVLSPPNVPPPPPQQNPTQIQLSPHVPQNQIPSVPQRDPYFPPPGQLPESPQQPYQLPPAQPAQPPPPAPHQRFQPVPQLPHYSQTPQLPQHHPPVGPVNPPHPQLQPSISHHSEENPYVPPPSYPPTVRQSPSMNNSLSGNPSSQQFYGTPAHMYDSPASRTNPGFSSGYGPSPGANFSDTYSYSGPPSPYGSSSTMKPPQLSSSPSAPSGGGSNYPRIPTAQLLPQALPTASSVSGSGSSSAGTGNRVPIDDVVDKVVSMGFSRDQVRTTVRKLTENGQSVDLNVVLDKLMNGGGGSGEGQPQKGWFGR
ncbi:Protein of unknown function DUF1421 [Macleaya cordata]|uniref:UBA domain-containing protein n=1 Tax=Macleaya cordata TaxID=56857 RepID=A0A200RDK0_MACCD|nr:Protein of unknown function DUF1421 [Macleaya cordata]